MCMSIYIATCCILFCICICVSVYNKLVFFISSNTNISLSVSLPMSLYMFHYLIHSFIYSGDLYSASSRDYYTEALPDQSQPKKKELQGDVEFGWASHQQETQLKGAIIQCWWTTTKNVRIIVCIIILIAICFSIRISVWPFVCLKCCKSNNNHDIFHCLIFMTGEERRHQI